MPRSIAYPIPMSIVVIIAAPKQCESLLTAVPMADETHITMIVAANQFIPFRSPLADETANQRIQATAKAAPDPFR